MKQIFAVGAGLIVAFMLTLTAAVAGDKTLAQSSFSGLNGHITTGDVSVVKAADGATHIVLGKSFTFDGAPDPQISLGKGGKYAPETNMGLLKSLNGEQVYVLPAGVDLSNYSEIFVYCVKFNVPLGVAKL